MSIALGLGSRIVSGGCGWTGRLVCPDSDVVDREVVKGEFGPGDRLAFGLAYGAVQRAVPDGQGVQLKV
jgi:hypothetical protein